MTLSETEHIIKALESEIHRAEYTETDYLDCVEVKDLKLALELIKDLQEENASLEAEIDKQYKQAKADILGNMSDGGTSCHWCIEQHRKNAFKEFAEDLKHDACGYSFDSDESNQTYQMIDVEDIDDLLKKKLGETDELIKETI